MRRFLFLMISLVLIESGVYAQSKWGLYCGGSIIGYKNVASDNGVDNSLSNTGALNYGLFLEFRIHNKLMLETGLFSGKKGFETVESITNVYEGPIGFDGKPEWKYTANANYNFIYKMPYVSIPIILNYYLVNRKFKFYVSFGQKVGLCFSSKTTNNYLGGSGYGYGDIPYSVTQIDTELPNIDIEVGKDGIFKAFQYDMVLGGGIAMGRFYLAYNYDMGVLNNSQVDLFEIKSRSHNVSLRIDFTKKK